MRVAIPGLILLLSAGTAGAYTVGYDLQLYPLGNENLVQDRDSFTDGQTSVARSRNASNNPTSASATSMVDLSTGSVRLNVSATGTAVAGTSVLARAVGSFTDTLYFDLPDGISSIEVPFSLTIHGRLGGPIGGASQGSAQARLGSAPAIGTGATSLTNLFGSSYAGVAIVSDLAPTVVSMHFGIAVQPGTTEIASVFADASNTTLFRMALPEGVSFTSQSGTFLSAVPLPAGVWLLGSALAAFGFLGPRRRRAVLSAARSPGRAN